MSIKGIVVQIENLGHRQNIYYHVIDNCFAWHMYNEKNIPDYIVELMNKSRAYKTKKTYYSNTDTTYTSYYYKF